MTELINTINISHPHFEPPSPLHSHLASTRNGCLSWKSSSTLLFFVLLRAFRSFLGLSFFLRFFCNQKFSNLHKLWVPWTQDHSIIHFRCVTKTYSKLKITECKLNLGNWCWLLILLHQWAVAKLETRVWIIWNVDDFCCAWTIIESEKQTVHPLNMHSIYMQIADDVLLNKWIKLRFAPLISRQIDLK